MIRGVSTRRPPVNAGNDLRLGLSFEQTYIEEQAGEEQRLTLAALAAQAGQSLRLQGPSSASWSYTRQYADTHRLSLFENAAKKKEKTSYRIPASLSISGSPGSRGRGIDPDHFFVL